MLFPLLCASNTDTWALSLVNSNGQARMVMNDPAVAPAAAKHAQEYMLGNLALSLVRDNTSTPKFFLIQAPYSFFDRTYIEKEIVRTSVTLAMGATTPWKERISAFSSLHWPPC